MWDLPPYAEILINDKSYFHDNITGDENKPDLIEFEHEFEEGKSHELVIKRSGKGRKQTVVDDEGNILKDQLLHIKNIEIDEINLGGLVYEGEYIPIYSEPWATQQRQAGNELKESFKNATQLGHNGTWHFKFESPFYMWLLENLY